MADTPKAEDSTVVPPVASTAAKTEPEAVAVAETAATPATEQQSVPAPAPAPAVVTESKEEVVAEVAKNTSEETPVSTETPAPAAAPSEESTPVPVITETEEKTITKEEPATTEAPKKKETEATPAAPAVTEPVSEPTPTPTPAEKEDDTKKEVTAEPVPVVEAKTETTPVSEPASEPVPVKAEEEVIPVPVIEEPIPVPVIEEPVVKPTPEPEPEPLKIYDDNHEDFLVDLREHELPKQYQRLHHSFGLSTDRRYNLHYIDFGVLLMASGNTVQLYDLKSNKKTVILGKGSSTAASIGAIAVHPEQKYFAVAERGDAPKILIYKYITDGPYEIVNVLREGTLKCYSDITFSPDGTQLASVGDDPDYSLTVWDWNQERVILRMFYK